MAQVRSDNILADIPKILDDKTGVVDATTGVWRAYNNVAEFTTRFPAIGRAEGQEFWVRSGYHPINADLYAVKKDKSTYKVFDTGVVNVMDFGATGDGVTDDSVAVQAAIEAYRGIGAMFLFPAGTFVLGDIQVPAGCSFVSYQLARDNYLSNVPSKIIPAPGATYVFEFEDNSKNCIMDGIYIDAEYVQGQPHNENLVAAVRWAGTFQKIINCNFTRCPKYCVLSKAGAVVLEDNNIQGWYGTVTPDIFTGINDFKGAFTAEALGDSYIINNEIGAGLSYFTSTVTPRDPTNGRIVSMALGSIFGGTSVISGNLFENGDRAVAIGNSLYCNFNNNRYELSAMGGLYIYGPMQFATFSQERFGDNSLSVEGAADDITIAIGAAGNIAFIAPTFESLVNGAIPNSGFKVNYHISNRGSDLVDLVTPIVDPTYSVNGLINLSEPTLLPVRQVVGQYDPANPRFESVSTAVPVSQVAKKGYVKLKQGTDTATSFVGAVEFWTPQETLAYSLGFSPEAYLALTGYGVNPILALNMVIALQRNGESKLTLWSLDGLGNSQIILQGGAPTTQGLITLNNTTGVFSIIGAGNIDLGANVNFRLHANGTTSIIFPPNPATIDAVTLVARRSDTGEMVSIDPTPLIPSSNYAIQTSSVPYTKALINGDFPSAKIGFTVIQDGAGMTYIKKDNSPTGNWSTFPTVQLT